MDQRLRERKTPYALHLGVTEAGLPREGTIKSAIGLGVLLWEGIGDTLRVSLAADPVEEIPVCWGILKALGLREKGFDITACPSCGRAEIQVVELARSVEAIAKEYTAPVKVAVMGCVVNGPGSPRWPTWASPAVRARERSTARASWWALIQKANCSVSCGSKSRRSSPSSIRSTYTRRIVRLHLHNGLAAGLPSWRLMAGTAGIALTASLALALAQPAILDVDGQRVVSDVSPVTSGGVAYLPLRAVSTAAGAATSFDPRTAQLTVRRGTDVLTMKIGERHATLDGRPLELHDRPVHGARPRNGARLRRGAGAGIGGQVRRGARPHRRSHAGRGRRRRFRRRTIRIR